MIAIDRELSSATGVLQPAEFSIVIPTYNEVGNLIELLTQIATALPGVRWEAIVVDDNSPDYTHAHARALARSDARVRVIRRIGRRGLASACIEGALSSSAPYVAVIDADLQHDPGLLMPMLQCVRLESVDLVVGSRYASAGGLGDWSAGRAFISRAAPNITPGVTHVALSDPMSGYFAVRREVFDYAATRLSGLGSKILLDLVLSVKRPMRIVEMSYTLGARVRG